MKFQNNYINPCQEKGHYRFELLEEIKSAIKLKANKKLMRQKIEQETGKMVTLKDLSKIKYKSKLSLNKNDIESIVKFLQSILLVYLLLVIDENGFSKIVGLFLVEEESKEVIESVVNKAWSPEAELLICLYHALRSFR